MGLAPVASSSPLELFISKLFRWGGGGGLVIKSPLVVLPVLCRGNDGVATFVPPDLQDFWSGGEGSFP
jgi:hypothetical protein